MKPWSKVKNFFFGAVFGLTALPLEANAQNVPEYDRDTFTDKKGNPVFAADQYDIVDSRRSTARMNEKDFLKALQEDNVLNAKEYRTMVPKMGSRTLDAVVQNQSEGTIDLHFSSGATLDNMTKASRKLHAAETHELLRFEDNGNGTLDGGDQPVERVVRVMQPAQTQVHDHEGNLDMENVTIVNIVYQDLENDPDNYFLYRAYLDDEGKQIVHDNEGRQLQGVGALKYMPVNEDAKQAFDDLLNSNVYPTGLTDFREFWNEFMTGIYHNHYENGGNAAQIITDIDFLEGDLQQIGAALSGKIEVGTLHGNNINADSVFDDNKADVSHKDVRASNETVAHKSVRIAAPYKPAA